MTRAELERTVGAFAFFGIVVGALSASFVAKVNPLAPRSVVFVKFADVDFLTQGDVVRSEGLHVGMVTGMSLAPDGVVAQMTVDPEVTLHPGYEVHIRSLSILGGRYVDLQAGDLDQPELVSTAQKPLPGTVERSLLETGGEIARTVEPMVVSIVANVNESMGRLDDATGTLGKLFSDGELTQNLEAAGARLETTSRLVRSMAAKAEEGGGTLGRLLREPRFEAALEGTRDRLDSIATKLSEGRGPLGALARDEGLGAAVEAARGHVESLAAALTEEGEGRAGWSAERWRADLAKSAANVETIVLRVQAGNGPLLVLLRDDAAQRSLDATRANLDTFAARPKSSSMARIALDPVFRAESELAFRDVSVGFGGSPDGADDRPVSTTIEGYVRGKFNPPPHPYLGAFFSPLTVTPKGTKPYPTFTGSSSSQ